MWPALVRFFDAQPNGHPHRLRELLDSQGGFTVCLRSGRSVGSGISVGTRPSSSISFARSQWCDRLVDEWVMSAASEPMWRSSHIGGWVDPASGQVWLDRVRVVPAPLRSVAVMLGRAANQHCVFDLGSRQTVLVG